MGTFHSHPWQYQLLFLGLVMKPPPIHYRRRPWSAMSWARLCPVIARLCLVRRWNLDRAFKVSARNHASRRSWRLTALMNNGGRLFLCAPGWVFKKQRFPLFTFLECFATHFARHNEGLGRAGGLGNLVVVSANGEEMLGYHRLTSFRLFSSLVCLSTSEKNAYLVKL